MDFLVPYSSSEDDEEADKTLKRNTTAAPKLPCALSKLGARTESKHDDDALYSNASVHNNRIRSFKHERGNWATYIYLAVDESILEGIPEQFQAELEDVVELQFCKEFHISLSRTVVLQYHWIDNFVRSLEKILKSEIGFSVFLEQVEIYVNEDKTRTFIGFKVNSMKLMALLHKVDTVMEDFNLQRFYEDPSFHISFAWCLGDKYKLLTSHFERLMTATKTNIDKCLSRAINVDELHCKIGHKIYSFKLSTLS